MKTAASNDSRNGHDSTGAVPAPPDAGLTRAPDGTSAATADPPPHPEARATPTDGSPRVAPPQPPVATPPAHRWRKWLLLAGAAAGLAVAGYFLVPLVDTALNTVSTDDAYVNGHVTFVAPRVAGQVARVLVDDNDRVKKGDVLVQLDKEPFQVQVDLKRAAVQSAEANLAAAESKARSLEAAGGQPALEAPKRLRTGQRPDRPAAGQRGRPADQGGHARPDPARIRARPGRLVGRGWPSARRNSNCTSSSSASPKPPSSQAREEIYQVRAASGCRPNPKKARTSRTCRRTSTRPSRGSARRSPTWCRR